MPKTTIKIWLPILLLVTVLASLLLGGFLGLLLLHYCGMTVVEKTHWTTIVNNAEITVPFSMITEEKDTPPFAAHLEGSRKHHLFCDCLGECQTPWIGPYSVRSVRDQNLIRQRVINILGHTTLDWNITIDGFVSEDGKHYQLFSSVNGGNFAGTYWDFYADYNPDTQRLTLNVRQKLYREPFKRYQFEFELQDNPAPDTRFKLNHVEWERPSMFVPVKQ